ncbi:MAG: hypothetical protein WCT50_00800 [Patescibacteria group bacterium]
MGSTADEIKRVIICINITLKAVKDKLTAEGNNATPSQYKILVWEKEIRHLRRALEKKNKELKQKRTRVMA